MVTSTQTSTCYGASLVCLVEDDIPGAQLPRSTPEECSVTQLKRWLLCRTASTTGRKQQLVSRVKAYINSGLAAKNLRDPDGGIHLARRKAQLGILEVVEPDVKTSFPNEGFGENLEGLPEVNFKTIWTYMVACLDAKKQLSTAKPLVKGYNFYKSGHVLTIKSCEKDHRAFVKSQVLPSMKKTAAYTCYIILRRQGLVHRAFCGCPAGIDGRCNHVAATLFHIEVFCKSSAEPETATACTSQPCKWNVPRKRKGEIVPVSQMKSRKHEYGKDQTERSPQIVQYRDVRAPFQRLTSNTKLYDIFSKVKDFEEKTGKVLGLSHVLQQKTLVREILNRWAKSLLKRPCLSFISTKTNS